MVKNYNDFIKSFNKILHESIAELDEILKEYTFKKENIKYRYWDLMEELERSIFENLPQVITLMENHGYEEEEMRNQVEKIEKEIEDKIKEYGFTDYEISPIYKNPIDELRIKINELFDPIHENIRNGKLSSTKEVETELSKVYEKLNNEIDKYNFSKYGLSLGMIQSGEVKLYGSLIKLKDNLDNAFMRIIEELRRFHPKDLVHRELNYFTREMNDLERKNFSSIKAKEKFKIKAKEFKIEKREFKIKAKEFKIRIKELEKEKKNLELTGNHLEIKKKYIEIARIKLAKLEMKIKKLSMKRKYFEIETKHAGRIVSDIGETLSNNSRNLISYESSFNIDKVFSETQQQITSNHQNHQPDYEERALRESAEQSSSLAVIEDPNGKPPPSYKTAIIENSNDSSPPSYKTAIIKENFNKGDKVQIIQQSNKPRRSSLSF